MSLLFAALIVAQTSLTPAEAKAHLGEMATVCGKVVSARFAESSTRQPTFLNLDQPFPKQIFTVVIFGSDRSQFGEPEKEFVKQTICATGTIEDYRGLPQIVAKEPKQIVKGDSRRD
jgi:DNA/RNA endonuclease YhcR with UshA esterase domain